jgi:hypothetical protein
MLDPKPMEPAIRQYDFTVIVPPITFSWRKKVAVFFVVGCFMFGFRWIIESILHWDHHSIIRALIEPVVLAAVFAFRPFHRWSPQYQSSIVIGQDFLEGRARTGWFTFKKRIRRDRIKSISENRRGLWVMDRSEFAARMLGFVHIPATLPEYQEIRSELTRWAPVKVRN